MDKTLMGRMGGQEGLINSLARNYNCNFFEKKKGC